MLDKDAPPGRLRYRKSPSPCDRKRSCPEVEVRQSLVECMALPGSRLMREREHRLTFTGRNQASIRAKGLIQRQISAVLTSTAVTAREGVEIL